MCGGGETSPDGDRVRDFGRRRCIGVPGRAGVPAPTGRFVVAAYRFVVGTLGRGRLWLLIVRESDSRHPHSGGQRVELCEGSVRTSAAAREMPCVRDGRMIRTVILSRNDFLSIFTVARIVCALMISVLPSR